MNILFILLVVVSILVTLVRWIRWVALVQQKEYRFDRLWLFVQTKEGALEWLWLPSLHNFTRTGLKRPKLTLRSAATAILSLLIWFGITYICWLLLGTELSIPGALLLAGVVNLLIPVVVSTVGIVPGVLYRTYSMWLLYQAGRKIAEQKPVVVGITGSYGKTATKILLAHVLEQKFSVFMPPRSHNTILSISQSILQGYTNQQVAIIEYGAYRKGEIKRLAAQLRPSMAILTGLAEQHLGLFGSLAKIIEAKSELLDGLQPGSTVYSANEAAQYIAMAKDYNSLKVIKIFEESPISGKLIDGQLVVVHKNTQIPTKLVGLHYLDAVKTVWRVARDLDMSDAAITQQLKSFVPPEGFTRIYMTSNGARVLDDGGTSNPAGFEAALQLAKTLKGTQKILVTSGIVDLGERSSLIHKELSVQAKAVVSTVWYVGQAGKDEFSTVFGKRFVNSEQEIINQFKNIDNNSVLVIEGRMPAWFTKLL